jgi:uncharacterized protein YqgC (DUF456 family)
VTARPTVASALAFTVTVGALSIIQIVAVWLAIGWTHRTYGATAMAVVAAVAGCVGGWFLFGIVEPAAARFADRRFGPTDSSFRAGTPIGVMISRTCGDASRWWRATIWWFAVVGPVVMNLVHTRR